ncbi:hypothetical protein AVEN_2799-1 [Araneus ventricosus]|uniref:Uncharacterized protein n=1 Tax=Araneus ventricosus TaxID=182803 RepID=A0A4Y2V892_ARAVE|nr:hypothetical protein AVEN_2799-1 [Araneus ventricosus]
MCGFFIPEGQKSDERTNGSFVCWFKPSSLKLLVGKFRYFYDSGIDVRDSVWDRNPQSKKLWIKPLTANLAISAVWKQVYFLLHPATFTRLLC